MQNVFILYTGSNEQGEISREDTIQANTDVDKCHGGNTCYMYCTA